MYMIHHNISLVSQQFRISQMTLYINSFVAFKQTKAGASCEANVAWRESKQLTLLGQKKTDKQQKM